MSFFQVEKLKCSGDGRCVDVCPIDILKMDTAKRMPFMVSGGEDRCIKCGHCVAACPSGAVSLECMPVSDCQPLGRDWIVPIEKMGVFLKARRSVRLYKSEPVARDTIERLIDIARYAPSGINRQPVSWAVIYQTEKVRRLSELIIDWMRMLVKDASPLAESLHMQNIIAAWDHHQDWICRGAPHIIIAYGLKDDFIAPQAATIALTYLELAAVSDNLGACWAGYVSLAINASAQVRKFVGISSKASCFGAMMVGHPKINYFRIPSRNKPHVIWR